MRTAACWIVVATALLAACAGPTPDPTREPTLVGDLIHPEAYQAARLAIDADHEHFAGSYPDKSLTLRVLVAVPDPGALAAISALLPPDARVAWDPVKRSSADLERLRDEITEMLRATNTTWAGMGIDVTRNRVEVEVVKENSALRERLTADYGDAAVLVVDPMAVPLICLFPDPDPSTCPN